MVKRNARAWPTGSGAKTALKHSVSVAALAVLLASSGPAYAQLVARRGATLTAPTVIPRAGAVQQRSQTATDALDRSIAAQSRAQQIRAMATQARAAVARSVPNGLQGLVVAQGITSAALASGALQAARDSTGRMTWQGASLPVETLVNGGNLVTITQTESRAILSWDRFDVGAQTTLQFDQRLNGVAQRDWVAVNRLVDPLAAPSQILGRIKADGTVVVINRNGMIFADGAQVSANSLLASSLDIGNFLKAGFRINPATNARENGFVGTTLQDRNIAFLQNGLLQSGVSQAGSNLAGMLTSTLVEGFYGPGAEQIASSLTGPVEGGVTVERGAKITAGNGGFVILTGPVVRNDGMLSATEGQVSLQAGRTISATVSTGAANSADPNVRGLILRTPFGSNGASAVNSGLIETKRGYASLGTGLLGSVTNSGLIAATTSVSRNGSISMTGGSVTLSGASDPTQASGLVILADDNGETIPQGTSAQPASFKSSQIQIGGVYLNPIDGAANPLGELGPAAVNIGQNALILAPNANVAIGGELGEVYSVARFSNLLPEFATALQASRIDIADGALIDVSGVKDVLLDASRNSLLIDPVKRNELRDTPNYRETNTSGEFTLNGSTVYVDPRITGVRADGVAYVGSPLIEAGSAASQIGVTSAELMTRGGTLSLNTTILEAPAALASTPRITIARDAVIDFSGGWVRYADGIVRTSRLLTADGRIIDIGRADPNDSYVALGDGFSEVQAKFGISRTYASSILQGEHFEFGYDEGRDAGALILSGSSIVLGGTLHGDAFAGQRQRLGADRSGAASSLPGDLRRLQSRPSELPSGGFLRVGAFDRGNSSELTGDIMLGGNAATAPVGAILLDDEMLSNAGLSALSLRTTGGLSFAAGSNLTLANGGALAIEAGRAVQLDGTVRAPSGSITVRTVDYGRDTQGLSRGSQGSPFRSDDNLIGLYSAVPDIHPFDITVGGTLSTAGLWVNDFAGASRLAGSAWGNGGSISLTVAPNVFVGIGTSATNLTDAADLSGSIRISPTALLNVSSGGYVAPDGSLELTARGGNVALINETHYASFLLTDTNTTNEGLADQPIGGTNQSVAFTPYLIGDTSVVPALVPLQRNAVVSFDVASISGFGFGGGGIFQLVAPNIAMGSQPGGAGPQIGLDFLQRTGFGTLSLSALKSRIVSNLFTNGQTGDSAFIETERFVIGAGETLDLTQTVLPSLLDAATTAQLTNLASGADLLSVLTPAIPVNAWDRLAANLHLGGVTELEVAEGGSITGATGASITIPRLYNAGTIRIAGGHIVQNDTLDSILRRQRAIGVRDVALGGGGLSDLLGGGVAGQLNGFDENAALRADVFRDLQGTQRLTNGQLFSLIDPASGGRNLDATLIFTGRVALNEGIHLAAGSVTDLSGTAIYNPRAPFLANGQQMQQGRMVGGGSISTSRFGTPLAESGYSSAIDPSNKLVAEAGAAINLDGASGSFDERTSQTSFGRVAQWSDAGRLAIGNGAALSGALLSGHGGDDGDANLSQTRARGGVLDWVAPVIRQTDDGSDPAGSTLYAAQIMAAGFDSLIARDGFTTAGVVQLDLARSFIATTDTRAGSRTTGNLSITAAAGSDAWINAPYIRLASSNRTIGAMSSNSGSGSLTLSATALDIVGAVAFNVGAATNGADRGSVRLEASGDIRLIGTAGVADRTTGLFQPGLTGQLVSSGDLHFNAGQVYATTGTGNLQQMLEDRRAGRTVTPTPYVIASTNVDGLVSFAAQGSSTPAVPLSAGTHLAVLGAHIEQNGVLRAPLGLLEIGSNQALFGAPATATVRFGEDSITSVSARTSATGTDALNVPYGTTTDLIEYFFTPGTTSVLTTTPVGELRLAGMDITIASDGTGEVRVDGRGGGDVFAYEFIPGTGGSRDLLDRFNPDSFSGNNGLQFADGRQVFAIIPRNTVTAALFDPIYSADYSGGGGIDLYGADAGLSVYLDAAPGIEAGEYLLLPAHYALLPGALRIVENAGASAPYAGGAARLLDGSIVVGGNYTTAGTGFAESQRRSFTVQSKDVFTKYSRIETTSGSTNAQNLAAHNGQARPLLPRDAARVVLSPLTSLRVAGLFATDPASNGLGSQIDIGGTNIRIAAPGALPTSATSNYVLLTTDTLANFNANSLSIGALRTNNIDGTTTLDVVARNIFVDNNVDFAVPELLLAVGGARSLLAIADAPRGGTGARLTASGTLNDLRTGDYIINATGPTGATSGQIDLTGSGALIRLATGPERLISREGDFLLRNTLLPSRLDIGAGATLAANSIALDSSRTFAIDRTARIGATTPGGDFSLAVSGDALRIGSLTFRPEIEAQFGLAASLTYRSPDIINFGPGTYNYRNLTIDAAGIGLLQPIPLTAQTSDLTLNADHVTLRNSFADVGACAEVGARLCGATSALTINASDITFGGGQFRTYGFDAGIGGTGVTLAARDGMYITGQGGFSTINADESLDTPLNLLTPFIIDRTATDDLRSGFVRPDYTFASVGAINVIGTGSTAAVPTGGQAPGARIAFNSGSSFNGIGSDTTITDALIRATAGTIEVRTPGSIHITGTASLQTPGYTRTFDDGVDRTVVSAGGGVINLITTGLGTLIDTSATSSLIVDSGVGEAGTLNIVASQGAVNLRSSLNTAIAASMQRSASFRLDAGQSAFDLQAFVGNYGTRFQGDLAIRSGFGDLSLLVGQQMRADSVSLTADGGIVSIAGLIDTSGDNVQALALTDPRYNDARVDGGAISLFGRSGVTLASTAALVSTTSGYGANDARQASGGAITIGIGIPENPAETAALSIASGATIDVRAVRSGDRIIDEVITDPITKLESIIYRLARGDAGGSLTLRAPVLAGNTVNIANSGTVTGTRELTIEGYRRFDLDAIASAGIYSGVSLRQAFPSDVINLDAAEIRAGAVNFLADLAPGTLPDFIRNFSITGAGGEEFVGYRVRPGVELVSVNDIRLLNSWNLGAGQIVNADGTAGYADALAAGLLAVSPLSQYGNEPRYEVVAGAEAELFQRFVAMTYRVGGAVAGEAPVLTLRAGGNLDIRSSISDGFFTFHDLTNPDFIDYQLGGGDRTYAPALNIACGVGDAASCSDSITFGAAPTGPVAGAPATRVTIQIGTAQQGGETSPLFVDAPYNPGANAASANGTGDALGVAELFPLLADGSAAHSTSLKLVGGALAGSANPLQIDISLGGSVVVSGETSYQISGTRGTARIDGPLQLAFSQPGAARQTFGLEELLALIDSGSDGEFQADYYTVLNWGISTTGAAGAARDAALAYPAFRQNNRYLGSRANPTGVAAPLRDVVAFLLDSGFGETFSQGVAQGLPGFNAAANLLTSAVNLQSKTAYVGTTVRTGDGTIDVAAASNIDLRGNAGVILRRDPGAVGASATAEIGGAALYTAGVRASSGNIAGAVLPQAGPAAGFIPGPTSGLAQAPVFNTGGGAITLTAGQDILGRRDVWNELFGQNGTAINGVGISPILLARGYPGSTALTSAAFGSFGANSGDQRWRYGEVSSSGTQSSIAFNYFTSGVGALGGGDVTIRAGRDVSDLTIALDNSLVTGSVDGVRTLVALGSGDLRLDAGRNLNGGQFDIASGAAVATVGASVGAAGTTSAGSFVADNRNLLRIRLSDATFDLAARGEITLGGLGALSAGVTSIATAGFFSSIAGARLTATGDVTIVGNRAEQFILDGNNTPSGYVLPPSLALTSFNGDLAFGFGNRLNQPRVLYASEYGQLSLFAGGDISRFGLAMSDAAPAHLLGFDSFLSLSFPGYVSDTSDAALRQLHNRRITHLNDPEPIRIVAGGSIEDVVLSLPKQAYIRAQGNIVDLVYQGQNNRPTDTTKISAGGDITGSTGVSTDGQTLGRSAVLGNSITLGGPGALFVEAGRDLGPFVTSATGTSRTEAGGIRTIGNEANPWLNPQGADLYVLFGVANGADYAALQTSYLDPANLAQLDGDLFVQVADALGNKSPDRNRYSYAPVLAEWLRDKQPEVFAAVFGPNPPSGDALKTQAYARYADIYAAFTGLDQQTRNRFLIDKIYFGELAAPSDPTSESFNQFVRGYRAAQTLFPAHLGYTDNLSTYTTDPSTISADHPLGIPVKKLIDGQPAVATTVETGNVDLRLSTIQTARGGDITILGPGGNFVAGSVVRTSAQISRRTTVLPVGRLDIIPTDLTFGDYRTDVQDFNRISSIPAGLEGLLTLRGGSIRGFTDGSFVLNQSRLFTLSGGDITMWSSNGDLNAGQGPRSSSNFPPIVLRYTPNGFSEVDSAGSVAGAGIAAFRPSLDIAAAAVRLIAPVGTVDAGDAGVRASGDVFVAAARVTNSDNFAAGGSVSGVPSLNAPAAPPVPAGAASAVVANAFRAADAVGDGAARVARIFVDVLGNFGGGSSCPDGQTTGEDGQCMAEPSQ